VGVYTKSKTSELSPLRRKLLRFVKQFPPPLRSNYYYFFFKSNFHIVRVFCATKIFLFFLTLFFKKSYLSLSTDYTYKFLVNDR
jgi:hypothetical protein